MKNNQNMEEIKKTIIPILKSHGAKKAGLFGSCVRDEMKLNSDIDILVQIDDDISLLDLVDLKLKLEEALGRKVDLVEYDTIKPMIREKILREEMAIL